MSRLKKRQRTENNDNRKLKDDDDVGNNSTLLEKCSICNRRFTSTRLIQHQQACQQSNSFSQYRYNSPVHRWQGLDYQINFNQTSSINHDSKFSWREQHEQFQNVVRGEYSSYLDNRSYQCSQCHRKFAQENGLIKHQKACRNKRQLRNAKSKK